MIRKLPNGKFRLSSIKTDARWKMNLQEATDAARSRASSLVRVMKLAERLEAKIGHPHNVGFARIKSMCWEALGKPMPREVERIEEGVE